MYYFLQISIIALLATFLKNNKAKISFIFFLDNNLAIIKSNITLELQTNINKIYIYF